MSIKKEKRWKWFAKKKGRFFYCSFCLNPNPKIKKQRGWNFELLVTTISQEQLERRSTETSVKIEAQLGAVTFRRVEQEGTDATQDRKATWYIVLTPSYPVTVISGDMKG